MSKIKGHQGETCAEALQAVIKPGEVIPYAEFFAKVKAKGAWEDGTIFQHLMSCVVNLPPARRQWKSRKPFLFLRPDGQYELFDRSRHPETVE